MRTLDWHLIFMLLPKRRFTPAELARAIPDPPSASVVVAVLFNLLLVGGLLGVFLPMNLPMAVLAFVVLHLSVILMGLWAVWRDPGCRAGRWAYYGLPAAQGLVFVLTGALRDHAWHRVVSGDMMSGLVVGILLGLASMALWFTIVHRHQYVVMRLAELDERDRAIEMARQLGSAQIQPHFLFNTLASVQHWVATGDARAAGLLDALTGYLRATLPLFEHRQLRLVDELEAVRRYLAVMQLRLGDERLQARFQIDPALDAVALPPGLLLTLVENAVEHGVQARLRDGEVLVATRRQADGSLHIVVADNGPGLPAGLAAATAANEGELNGSHHTDQTTNPHLGLRNTRTRLAQGFGPLAQLRLGPAATGGCEARIELPASAMPAASAAVSATPA